jgi:hypothetical protein
MKFDVSPKNADPAFCRLAMLKAAQRLFGRIVASPEPVNPGPLRRSEKLAVWGVAVALGAWIFAFHLKRFNGLGTSSDLYAAVQGATFWLDGRFFRDNFFGDFLSLHTSFLLLPLAVLAYPFGAPGLLFALALAAALSLVALVRILRLAGVPVWPALAFATLSLLMPLSANVYQNDYRGFDLDLLEPALGLWLAAFLIQRRWGWSLTIAVLLISAKEDATLLVVIVAGVVWTEQMMRQLAGVTFRPAWNWPAIAVAVLAVAALPLLLEIIKSHQGGVLNLSKIQTNNTAIAGGSGLAGYVLRNLGPWLRSDTVATWLALAGPATFGLIWLRPHLLLIGVGTALTAWLVTVFPLLWPPRFAPSLTFFQLAGALAFASAWDLAQIARGPGYLRRVAAGVLMAAAGFAVVHGLWHQWPRVSHTAQIYTLSPKLAISAADRRQADELYAIYRREGRRAEPVMASYYLFRYAHDRNLLWPHSLRDRPVPTWILWDTEDWPLMGLWVTLKLDQGVDLSAYELTGRAGRFLLFRSRASGGTGPALLPEFTPVGGEPHGALKMQVQFKEGRAGHYEPLASLGREAQGDLFFVHYINERQLEIGMESMGSAVLLSQPVDYEPGQTYELELFCGSLAPPEDHATGAAEQPLLQYSRNIVSVKWEGSVILDTLAQPKKVRPEDVHIGANLVRSGSAEYGFTGRISNVRRGGYPQPPAPLQGEDATGAVRLVLQLPGATSEAPEPAVVMGMPGDATLSYVRVLRDGRIKVGAEFWGYGAFDSEPIAVPASRSIEIVFEFPGLFPPVGDPRWGNVPAAERQACQERLRIRVGGVVVLEQAIRAVPAIKNLHYGRNPVGGSWVTSVFTGQVLQVSRLPLAPP